MDLHAYWLKKYKGISGIQPTRRSHWETTQHTTYWLTYWLLSHVMYCIIFSQCVWTMANIHHHATHHIYDLILSTFFFFFHFQFSCKLNMLFFLFHSCFVFTLLLVFCGVVLTVKMKNWCSIYYAYTIHYTCI